MITTKFVDACQAIFGDNLICVLLLGSAQRSDTTPFSDIDLVVVVGKVKTEDLVSLRDFVRSLDTLVDCSVLGVNEISEDPDLFRIGTHGCYQQDLVLRHAEAIWGDNFFADLPHPSTSVVRRSVLEKVVEYVWWVRRMFVESNRPRSFELNYQLNSRIVKIVRDVVYLATGSGIRTPTRTLWLNFTNLPFTERLSGENQAIACALLEPDQASVNASDLSEEFFEARCRLVNALYEFALELA